MGIGKLGLSLGPKLLEKGLKIKMFIKIKSKNWRKLPKNKNFGAQNWKNPWRKFPKTRNMGPKIEKKII